MTMDNANGNDISKCGADKLNSASIGQRCRHCNGFGYLYSTYFIQANGELVGIAAAVLRPGSAARRQVGPLHRLVGQRTAPYRPRCELNRRYSSTDASISDFRTEMLSTLMPMGKPFSRA